MFQARDFGSTAVIGSRLTLLKSSPSKVAPLSDHEPVDGGVIITDGISPLNILHHESL